MERRKNVCSVETNDRGGGEGGTPSAQKRRDSNIELFRIITMLFIVAHHYVVNSGLTAVDGPIYADPLSSRSLFLLIIGAWGKTGINCFMLITGYYMCKSHITFGKFTKLLFEVMFYRVVIGTAFVLSDYERLSWNILVEYLLPVRSIGNGFTAAFLVFFLFIPFLNILVRNMSKRQHTFLIIWCGFTYVFLGTVPKFSVTMNYVEWFSVVFIIAAYIRLYPKRIYSNTRLMGCLTVSAVVADIITVIICAWLSARTGKRMAYSLVTDSNSFLAVTTGICAFLFFKNLKIPYNHFINTVGASTFGVLLIHANRFMRGWLWTDFLDCVGHYSSKLMPLYSICAVFLVFGVGTIIDIFRIHFIEKPFFKLWDKHWANIHRQYTKLEMHIASKSNI